MDASTLPVVADDQPNGNRQRRGKRRQIDHPVAGQRQIEALIEQKRQRNEARGQYRVQEEDVQIEAEQLRLERRLE